MYSAVFELLLEYSESIWEQRPWNFDGNLCEELPSGVHSFSLSISFGKSLS